jgi:hypothetical protein
MMLHPNLSSRHHKLVTPQKTALALCGNEPLDALDVSKLPAKEISGFEEPACG